MESTGETRGSRWKILVMDDEDLLITFTARMLRRMGYEVEVASHGAEAIELYRRAKASERPFDAVVLDLTIHGGIGGEEVLKKLYEIDAEVKAIASSGYSDDPVISGFGDYGFHGAIVKPYRIDEMSRIVSRVIGAPAVV
ncbi:MAG TPA: response regulator [Thermodesulfovibrionales bacterium]|nr:response regulator [Thermodesulfovibrionales bacterium]